MDIGAVLFCFYTKKTVSLRFTRPIFYYKMAIYINPYTDFGFKKLFGEEANKEVLIAFLNALLRDEVFGPVLIAMPFDDINEVIAAANDSPYGLSASVWTQNIGTAQHLIENLQTGLIFVNSPVRSDNNLPLGGFKQSGIGRELGSAAIAQYTELKSVVVAYS